MEEKPEHSSNQSSQLKKVVLFGPESTGKTTLAKMLADYYQEPWVPEYMREFLERKWEKHRELIQKKDLIPIAKGQLKLEEEIKKKARNILICDTNLLEIKVYSEYYYNGYCPEFIKSHAIKNDYDLYLLTYIDTLWEADLLRDRPHNRKEMFDLFERELNKHSFPYQILKGNEEERFQEAVKFIENLKPDLL